MKKIFRNKLFLASSLNHTSIDIFNSARPVFLAFFSTSLMLNNRSIALAISLYQFTGAVTQPFFGWMVDRYGKQWMMGLSVLWSIGFIVAGVFAAQAGSFVGLMILFTIGSLGSAMFHPIGAKGAAWTVTQQAATATAFFFLFGQVGLAAGPLVAGVILDQVGVVGIPFLAIFAIPAILFSFTVALPKPKAKSTPITIDEENKTGSKAVKKGVQWGAIATLIVLTLCRSWALIGTNSFIPKLFQDQGWDATAYGAITSVMWFASAIAGVIAGNLADRVGRRQVVFATMLLAVPPLYFLPVADSMLAAFLFAFLAGGLTGAPHSIIVVIAQSLLPDMQATASGLILGLIFGMGALASLGIGLLADQWGLANALQLSAAMALVGALLSLMLPRTRPPETANEQAV